MKKILVFLLMMFCLGIVTNSCGQENDQILADITFDKIFQATALTDEVKEISYEQFVKLRESKDEFIIVNVLSQESYNQGHIAGTVSFPVDMINEAKAKEIIENNSRIIVYCARFACHASTRAAKALTALGYKVLDYKGGLQQWKEKGNNLVQ